MLSFPANKKDFYRHHKNAVKSRFVSGGNPVQKHVMTNCAARKARKLLPFPVKSISDVRRICQEKLALRQQKPR
jgi:hypothetical protein